MKFMVWNDSLLTGIEIVDRQHRGLVELVNQVAPLLAASGGQRVDDFAPLRDRLMAYAASHFKTEEDLMVHYRVDSRVLDHHRQSHAAFVDRIRELADHFASGRGVTGSELLSFLAGWLMFHILGEDQTMARQILAIDSGLSAERAYAEAGGYRVSPSDAALTQTLVGLYSEVIHCHRQSQCPEAAVAKAVPRNMATDAESSAHPPGTPRDKPRPKT
jgi:hemerythrin-like metal-binding protein